MSCENAKEKSEDAVESLEQYLSRPISGKCPAAVRLIGSGMQLCLGLFALLILSGIVGLLGMSQDETPLIIAVTAEGPEMDSQVSPRFGHANYCTIVHINSKHTKSVLRLDPLHTGYDLVNELMELKVGVVITGKIGPNALSSLRTAEVKVIQGVSGTVEEALRHFESSERQ